MHIRLHHNSWAAARTFWPGIGTMNQSGGAKLRRVLESLPAMKSGLDRSLAPPGGSGSSRQTRAFTVTELLVAVAIMSVIVIGLYQMFNQTQKALRSNLTQVDVLESGRAALQIMSRELEQLGASGLGGTTNLYVGMIPSYPTIVQTDLDDKTPLRTNVLEEFFFLRPETNTMVGTGYRVIGAKNGVGALYRFSVATNAHRLRSNYLSGVYFTANMTNPATGQLSTNFHRIADGIIHLRLLAYDPAGQRLGFETTNFHSAYRILRQSLNQRQNPGTNNVVLRQDVANQTQMIFLTNALPAYLELELGVLEQATLIQYDSLRDGAANVALDFLKKKATKVHLFRQRIPIRTAASQ
jgi:prepilin-type N-terminal cleavage/methylation domain-containing protein